MADNNRRGDASGQSGVTFLSSLQLITHVYTCSSHLDHTAFSSDPPYQTAFWPSSHRAGVAAFVAYFLRYLAILPHRSGDRKAIRRWPIPVISASFCGA